MGLIWAKKPILGPNRTQMGSAHMGPIYTCLLGGSYGEGWDPVKIS